MSYPKKFDWTFNYGDVTYVLKCKEKMYWDTYKFKATDIQVTKEGLTAAGRKDYQKAIAEELNSELK